MNLDELQSVQARERQSSDLQHLRASFYREVGEYVRGLSEERDRLVEQAEDPFSAPEVRQLTDDIETAEQTVEAIYERRVGKVVKKASIAAAGMPVDADGLTEEEEALFEDLVARIEGNRETVLSVLDGETPDLPGADGTAGGGPGEGTGDGTPDTAGNDADATPDSDPDATPDPDPDREPEPDAGGVSAADLMGGESDAEADTEGPGDTDATAGTPDDDPLAADPGDGPTEVPPESGPPGGSDPADEPTAGERSPSSDDATDDGADSADDGPPEATQADREVPGIPRTTVRITADVGEVVGADDRDYDLGPEDVVTLPEPNADVLVENDAAERLE